MEYEILVFGKMEWREPLAAHSFNKPQRVGDQRNAFLVVFAPDMSGRLGLKPTILGVIHKN